MAIADQSLRAADLLKMVERKKLDVKSSFAHKLPDMSILDEADEDLKNVQFTMP